MSQLLLDELDRAEKLAANLDAYPELGDYVGKIQHLADRDVTTLNPAKLAAWREGDHGEDVRTARELIADQVWAETDPGRRAVLWTWWLLWPLGVRNQNVARAAVTIVAALVIGGGAAAVGLTI